jgi:predicted RNA binding protein YcfA (HicA-like mRNA interferase family)
MVREIKYRAVAKELKAHGWTIDRTAGSHESWKNGSGHMTVPNHGNVSKGVVRQIIKTLGYTPKGWE